MPCRPTIVAAAGLLAAFAVTPASAAPGEAEARDAARGFGMALEQGRAAALRPLLPEQGKVQLSLARLGPEQGAFSSKQVEALFGSFLEEGSVTGFTLVALEHQPQCFAMARGRALVTDRSGHTGRVELYLAFRPEGDRWVLREIRETPE